MKSKLKQFLQLILILYFSNSWEIEAIYQTHEDLTEYPVQVVRIMDTNDLLFYQFIKNIEEAHKVEKDGVVVKELINNEFILENL